MAMQRSDAAKAPRTKTADVAVVKRGSMMLSAKRSSAQRMRKNRARKCMEIADFGSCHWQPQRVGSTLGEEAGAVSQSEVWRFRDGKPTRMRVFISLAMSLRAAHA